MSSQTLIPVPYFQFVPNAAAYNFAACTYTPVPNKRIHRHCPFITMDADYINKPLMNVAIAIPESDRHDSAPTGTQGTDKPHGDNSKSDFQNMADKTYFPTDASAKLRMLGLTFITNNLHRLHPHQDSEIAEAVTAAEKKRLDYLAQQPAKLLKNAVTSFKTVETPDNITQRTAQSNPSMQSTGADSHDTKAIGLSSTAENSQAADNRTVKYIQSMTSKTTGNGAKDDNNGVKCETYHSDMNAEGTEHNTEDMGSTDGDNTASTKTNNIQTDSTKTDNIKTDNAQSAEEEESELTEEERLKKEKEAKLESYKQFVAEQQSQVEIDYQGVRISIEANALPSRMYFTMNFLSAIIASYGLVINSAAVVIGAMLVAMMLGPITGVALAIIDYRIPFLRKSLMTVLAGGGMVVLVGFIVGLIHQDTPLTNEILSRTQPTSMDLMIALAGGTAGAYAMISPHLSVAVVGVAVATALVPPLAASGILFAHGQGGLGLGALLLAITNIIAIQFTNALVLWFSGFRRLIKDDYKTHTLVAFFRRNTVPLVLLAGIGIYLSYNFNTITKKQTFENSVKETLNDYFIEQGNALTTTQFVNREDYQTVRVVIRGETRPAPADAKYLEQVINEDIATNYRNYLPVRIQLRYMPVVVIESSPEHKDDIDKTDAAILANE